MISASSRYANSAIVTAQNEDGTDIQAIVFTPPADTVIQYTMHQVTGADTIDLLANQYYGDPTLWWQIANANPEILNWSSLTVGYLLRIPLINGLG